jgi:ketosteroid isomerase-like protein
MVSHPEAAAPPRASRNLLPTLPAGPVLLALLLGLSLGGCASTASRPAGRASRTSPAASAQSATAQAQAEAALRQATVQVIGTERAFATTMANRDLKAFLRFLSPDAIFFSGSSVERGQAQIAEQWAPYFQGRRAPFSWQPDDVQVLEDGKLALSTGPLLQNGHIVGRFNSVWRLEAPGIWRIIFDKGEAVCSAPPPTTNSNGEQFFDNPSTPRR